MRPAMASIPSEGAVQNAPVIYRAARRCILPSSYMFLAVGAPLKNQSWKPYNAIGSMHVLYRRRFWMGNMPRDALPKSFIALRVERHLVV